MKTFFMTGTIGWEVTADKVSSFLSEAAGSDIAIFVSSPGGYVLDAYDIKDMLLNYKGKITFVLGALVASAASYIVSIKDAERIGRKNTLWLHHNVFTVGMGDYRALREAANFSESLTKIIAESYSNVSGKEIKKIRKEMDEETWLFGDEIKNDGFATRILNDDEKIDYIEFDEKNKKENLFPMFDMQSNKEIEVVNCKTQLRIVNEKCKRRIETEQKDAAFISKINNIVNKSSFKPNELENKGAKIMDINEFLAQGDAYQDAFNALVDKNSKEIINKHIENVEKILVLSGSNIPEIALNAIKNNKTVEEFAIDELNAQRKSSGSPQNFGKFIDSAGKTPDNAKDLNDDWDKALKKVAEKTKRSVK